MSADSEVSAALQPSTLTYTPPPSSPILPAPLSPLPLLTSLVQSSNGPVSFDTMHLKSAAIFVSAAQAYAQSPPPFANYVNGACVTNYDANADVDYFPAKSNGATQTASRVGPDYSLLWDVTYHKTYKVIDLSRAAAGDINKPYSVLYQCGTPQPDLDATYGAGNVGRSTHASRRRLALCCCEHSLLQEHSAALSLTRALSPSCVPLSHLSLASVLLRSRDESFNDVDDLHPVH